MPISPTRPARRGYRSDPLHSALSKVEWITTVWWVISVRGVWRWAAVSNERAVANARAAATECSRLRVERAEVDQYLTAYAAGRPASTVEVAAKVVATGR